MNELLIGFAGVVVFWQILRSLTQWYANKVTMLNSQNAPIQIAADEFIGVALDGSVIPMRIKSRSEEVIGKFQDADISRYIRTEDGLLFEYEGAIVLGAPLTREDASCLYLLLEPGLMYREMKGYK
jgi:hypothetical protein